jgi:hypothetical protein
LLLKGNKMSKYPSIALQFRLHGQLLKPRFKQLDTLAALTKQLQASEPFNEESLTTVLRTALPQKLTFNKSKFNSNYIGTRSLPFRVIVERVESEPTLVRWQGTILPSLPQEYLSVIGEITYISRLYTRNGIPSRLAVDVYHEPDF